MAHSLTRLTAKLYNTPHLMTTELFEQVADYLDYRNSANFVPETAINYRERTPEQTNIVRGVGVLSITGPLTYLEYQPECGEAPTSYQQLHSEASAMISSGIKTVVMDVDSGGGEAYGMMEEARAIREMCDANNVKLIAYIDGLSASAAYGLSAVAHEVIANPDSEVGSIGVVVSLLDASEFMKAKGLRKVFVTAGKNKVPFDGDGKFTESFISDVQEKVDALYDKFVAHVSAFRNMSTEAVKATEAGVFMADEALELGLIDATMTRKDFLKYLADDVEARKSNMGIMNRLFKEQKTTQSEMTVEEIQQKLTEVTESAAALEADLQEAVLLIEEQEAKFSEQTKELKQALEKIAAFEAKEAEAAAAEQAAKEAAAQTKSEQRLAKLTSLLGDEKGAEQFAKIGNTEDEVFNMVVEGIEAKSALEGSSKGFIEMGLSGSRDLSAPEEDPTTRKLKQMHGKDKKLENK